MGFTSDLKRMNSTKSRGSFTQELKTLREQPKKAEVKTSAFPDYHPANLMKLNEVTPDDQRQIDALNSGSVLTTDEQSKLNNWNSQPWYKKLGGDREIAQIASKQRKADIQKQNEKTSSTILGAVGHGAIDAGTFGLAKKMDTAIGGNMSKSNDIAKESHPTAYGAGEIIGSSAPWMGAEGAISAVGKPVLKSFTSELAKRMLVGGAAGALTGGVQSAVNGNKPVEIAKDAALGMSLGVGGEMVGAGVNKIIGALASKIKTGKALTQAEKEIVKKTPELLALPETKKILALPEPKLRTPDVIEALPPKPTRQELNSLKSSIKTVDQLTGDYIPITNMKIPKEVLPNAKGLAPSKIVGNYTLKNNVLQKAWNDYDNAVETIHNYFGTSDLRADEVNRIKPELGIDLDKLISNIEEAQGKKIPSQDYMSLKRTAGIYSPGQLKLSKDLRMSAYPKLETGTEQILQNKNPVLSQNKLPSAIDQANKEAIANKKAMYNEAVKNLSYNVPEQYKRETPFTVFKSSIPPKVESKYAKEILSNQPSIKNDSEFKSPNKGMDYTTLKDASGFNSYTNDVYRIFKKVYGNKFDEAKKTILDPFDAAKKANQLMQKDLLGKLKSDVVDKFGITKGSKNSALVQQYGEKKITLDELKRKAPDKWQNIVKADEWFRNQYDTLLNKVNESMKIVYPNNPEKIIPKRSDYYRHFNELNDTITGIKNLFETPASINPSLVGVSDFTSPKSKFLSFAQKRGLGPYKNDAVGGFLNYVKPASYAVNINPQIAKFRELSKNIADQTENSKNLNHFIEYLQDFSNSLAGKTNPFDRPFQKVIGRKAMNIINWSNSRVKANTVLGNASSTLAQIANVPNGIAYVKNPVHLVGGMVDTLKSIVSKDNPMKESGFLMERYGDKLYRKFDTKWIDQPKKFASWLLEAGDEVGTKFIWNSVYRNGLAQKVSNPIKHADDVTRSLVAGRGIGETPLIQQSKIFQVVAPFQLEVGNLWRVMGDRVKEKDFAGIATLLVANYMFNRAMEHIRGSGVTFDPIKAVQDAFTETDKEGNHLNAMQKAGRLGGEVLSNIPLGQTIAAQLPDDIRKTYFGKEDPARFGTGLVVTKGIQDPLYKLAFPFGGGQVEKSIQAAQALIKGGVYATGKDGESLKYGVDNNLENKIKGGLFGKSGFSETKDYYDNNKRPLSAEQTKALDYAKSKGINQKTFTQQLDELRNLKPLPNKKGVTDSQKSAVINKNNSLTVEQKRLLINLLVKEDQRKKLLGAGK